MQVMFGRWKKNKRIYLDHASATPIAPEALRAMERASHIDGNPGSIHTEGLAAAKELGMAREGIARFLGCRAREVVLTSGATEANNLAILGYFEMLEQKGVTIANVHAICSAIEHPSVLACFMALEARGVKVSYVLPDAHGRIRPEAIQEALCEHTAFISIGWANGEIGVIQPLSAIAKTIRTHEGQFPVVFHSDAGQAPLYLASQVHSLGIDLFTIDSGKLYGPRGLGALYLADGIELAPRIIGGGQERGLRAGSENMVSAAGCSAALQWVAEVRGAEARRLSGLKSMWLQRMGQNPVLSDAIVNGDKQKHVLPHIINISIPGIQSEYITLALDHRGIALSTKSSCREGEQESHVVKALGGDGEWRSRNTLRFSMGIDTSETDVQQVLQGLSDIVQHYRSFSA